MSFLQSPRYVADMAIEADPAAPLKTFYMSFADGTRPKGTQFLGGLFIRAKSLTGALQASHRAGQNPGGEVRVSELPMILDPKWIGRLLSKTELEEFDRENSPN